MEQRLTQPNTRQKTRIRKVLHAEQHTKNLGAAMLARHDHAMASLARGMPSRQAWTEATAWASTVYGVPPSSMYQESRRRRATAPLVSGWPGIVQRETPTPPLHSPGWSPNVIPDDVRDPRFIRTARAAGRA